MLGRRRQGGGLVQVQELQEAVEELEPLEEVGWLAELLAGDEGQEELGQEVVGWLAELLEGDEGLEELEQEEEVVAADKSQRGGILQKDVVECSGRLLGCT